MKSSITATSGSIWAIVISVTATMLISLVFAAVFAALVENGVIPAQSLSAIVYGISAVSALVGGILCGKKASKARLPLCVASCGIYLLIIFVLRGLVFKTVTSTPWIIPICAFIGAIIGAMLSSKSKRRHS